MTPDEGSPEKRGEASDDGRLGGRHDGSDYSPRENSRSPAGDGYVSPKTNGRSRSASPKDDRSPMEDDDARRSPRGSESP